VILQRIPEYNFDLPHGTTTRHPGVHCSIILSGMTYVRRFGSGIGNITSAYRGNIACFKFQIPAYPVLFRNPFGKAG